MTVVGAPGIVATLLALAFVGSITLTHQPGTQTSTAREVEVKLAPLAKGSSGGQNGTAGSASVAGSLVSLRTNLLWLNNTNATGAWYARVATTGQSGLGNAAALTVGIDNGTASIGQVVAAAGALTQTTGSLVRLEPASANRIYLTQAVALLGPDTTVALEIVVTDDPTETATVTTKASLTIT